MTEEQAASSAGTVQEVDRIRDIIFGSQMRDYDQRFQIVQRDLSRLQQELDRLADQMSEQDREQSKKLQALRGEMRQADDDLRDELRQAVDQLTADKMDRAALGDCLSRWDSVSRRAALCLTCWAHWRSLSNRGW